MIKAVRGTRDLLPPETALWNFVEAAVRTCSRLQLSGDSHAHLRDDRAVRARRGRGNRHRCERDVHLEDRGRAQSDQGQSLTLRPENTAGVVRAYIEHKLWDKGLQKLYYIGPQFSQGASAEGPVPPVLPDWRGSHRAYHGRE